MVILDITYLWYHSTEPVGQVRFDKIREWFYHNINRNTGWKEVMTHRGLIGLTPLHNILSKSPPLDIIETFIRYAPETVRILDDQQRLPIHHASHWTFNGLKIVQALVNSYPESIKVIDIHGCLPLHLACWTKAPLGVVNFLIESYPESIKVRDNGGLLPCSLTGISGCLPIHYACCSWMLQGSHSVVKFLAESYPESIKVTDSSGFLPLHRAIRSEASLKIVSFLIDSYPEGITDSYLIPINESNLNPNERQTRPRIF